MRLAIVGSRDFSNLNLVREFVKMSLEDEGIDDEGVIIISGGARGVDRTAAEEVRKIDPNRLVEYLPDWDKHGKAAGFLRNTTIINDCDTVAAFWDGESRGTLDSIKKTVKAGKLVAIFGPNCPGFEEE